MTDKRVFRITSTNRRHVAEQVANLPEGYVIKAGPPTRSLDQNALMWPLLQDLAAQVVWHSVKLSPDDWKDMLTASLRKQRRAPGIDGGFVVFGERTRTYTKAEFSELIELIYAFGAQHGVNFGSK